GRGTLVLAGNNTYEGITNVVQGVVNVRSNTALGAATAGTIVATTAQGGAALQAEGTLTVAEPLSITEGGMGFGNGTDPGTIGAFRAVGSGTVTWTGNIELAGTTVIGVDGGALLDVQGVIANPITVARNLVKTGPGT